MPGFFFVLELSHDEWKDACDTLENYPKNKAKVVCEDRVSIVDPLKF